MTTQTSPRIDQRARQAVQLPPRLRQERVEVARWALAQGRPLNLDAITVVLGAKHFEAGLERSPFRRWTTKGVLTFALGSAVEWCLHQGVARPMTFGESLYTYVAWLGAEKHLTSGSSPLPDLLTTIADVTGLTRQGRARVGSAAAVTPRVLSARRSDATPG